jgi:hypothetical protein
MDLDERKRPTDSERKELLVRLTMIDSVCKVRHARSTVMHVCQPHMSQHGLHFYTGALVKGPTYNVMTDRYSGYAMVPFGAPFVYPLMCSLAYVHRPTGWCKRSWMFRRKRNRCQRGTRRPFAGRPSHLHRLVPAPLESQPQTMTINKS